MAFSCMPPLPREQTHRLTRLILLCRLGLPASSAATQCVTRHASCHQTPPSPSPAFPSLRMRPFAMSTSESFFRRMLEKLLCGEEDVFILLSDCRTPDDRQRPGSLYDVCCPKQCAWPPVLGLICHHCACTCCISTATQQARYRFLAAGPICTLSLV